MKLSHFGCHINSAFIYTKNSKCSWLDTVWDPQWMGRGRTWSRWVWRYFSGWWRSRRAGRRQLQQILSVWFGGRRAHDAKELLYGKHFNNLCFCPKFCARGSDECAASILIQHVGARSHTAIDLTTRCGGGSPYRLPKLQDHTQGCVSKFEETIACELFRK
jgi:hypothetical protein